ncbi:hypothetical protein BHM03_00048485, partial [Ensete ventricosum]
HRVVGSELIALRSVQMQILTTRNGGSRLLRKRSNNPFPGIASSSSSPTHLSAALINARSPVRKRRTHPAQSEDIVVT